MARRRVSGARQEAATYQAALRTIARERPVYSAMQAEDGHWYVSASVAVDRCERPTVGARGDKGRRSLTG
jgi:hypothetical protein